MKRVMKRLLCVAVASVVLFSSGLSVNATGLREIFDAEYYAEQYPDLKAAFGNDENALYQHFLTYGMKEGRVMNPIIDIVKYREQYGDLQAAFGNNWDAYVKHYFEFGVNEQRENGTDFDLLAYLEAYGDIKEAYGTDYAAVAKHYAEIGMKEGRNEGSKELIEARIVAASEANEDVEDTKDPEDTEDPKDPEDTEDPKDPEGTEDPKDPEGTEDPKDPEDTEDPKDPEGTEDPKDSEGTEDPKDPEGTEDPKDPEGTEDPKDPEGTEDPKDPEGTENPKDPEDTEDTNTPEETTYRVKITSGTVERGQFNVLDDFDPAVKEYAKETGVNLIKIKVSYTVKADGTEHTECVSFFYAAKFGILVLNQKLSYELNEIDIDGMWIYDDINDVDAVELAVSDAYYYTFDSSGNNTGNHVIVTSDYTDRVILNMKYTDASGNEKTLTIEEAYNEELGGYSTAIATGDTITSIEVLDKDGLPLNFVEVTD